MRRRFNITGTCNPQRHYMVRLDERSKEIKENYVDEGSYFVINRGRQYGKTTTLFALEDYLKDEYIVILLDFQMMGTEDFSDEQTFACAFAKDISKVLELMENVQITMPQPPSDHSRYGLKELFIDLSRMCRNSPRPIVLMIDEVDSASNNQVFIDFLAQLRGYYLRRDRTPTFHSVILAGVYDIKNLKLKLRPESEHQYNSPWNIAADFDVKMSFSVKQIASMLEEYETDYHTGMDIQSVAQEIEQYTSGYPVLVSTICKRIDEKIAGSDGYANPKQAWSKEGIEKAIKSMLNESTPLFDSMVKQLDLYKELYDMMLDMDLVLQKFVEYFDEIYNKKDADFIEKYGRKFFLLYLKPIINGVGNYYIEAQTRDERRTDVIVDYIGEQFIVELKIWHGREYNERGEQQLTEYLDYYHKDKGYMLSFNFNKEKQVGVKELQIGDKTIVEAVV